jgi:hypothetical protein
MTTQNNFRVADGHSQKLARHLIAEGSVQIAALP